MTPLWYYIAMNVREIISKYGLLGEPAFMGTSISVSHIPCHNGCPIGLYNSDTNEITLNPPVSEAVVLHELGHRHGDVYHGDLSEEYAERYRRQYQGGVAMMNVVGQAERIARAVEFPALVQVDQWNAPIYIVTQAPAAGKITNVLVWDYITGAWKAPPLTLPSPDPGQYAKPPMAITAYFKNTTNRTLSMRCTFDWFPPGCGIWYHDVGPVVSVVPGVDVGYGPGVRLQQSPGAGGGYSPQSGVLGTYSVTITLEAE